MTRPATARPSAAYHEGHGRRAGPLLRVPVGGKRGSTWCVPGRHCDGPSCPQPSVHSSLRGPWWPRSRPRTPHPRPARRRRCPNDALPTWQVNGVVWTQVTSGTPSTRPGAQQGPAAGCRRGGPGRDHRPQHLRLRHPHRRAGDQLPARAQRGGSRHHCVPRRQPVVVGGHFTRRTDGPVGTWPPTGPPRRPGAGLPAVGQRAATGRSRSPRIVYLGGSFASANGRSRARLAAVGAQER